MNVLNRLKAINHIPFPVRVRHLVPMTGTPATRVRGGNDWMELRNHHARYAIPTTREEWLASLTLDGSKDGQDPGLIERVESFAELVEREKITTVYSVGSGGAAFEFFLKKRLPHVHVIATECTQEGVDRLRTVFTEADAVELFDALSEESWKRVAYIPNAIVFIYRNEREFTDEEWRSIFSYMHHSQVQRVFLGLMWTLTLLSLWNRVVKITHARIHGVPVAFAGYIRNRKALYRLWTGLYAIQEEIAFPTCTGLYLKRNLLSL